MTLRYVCTLMLLGGATVGCRSKQTGVPASSYDTLSCAQFPSIMLVERKQGLTMWNHESVYLCVLNKVKLRETDTRLRYSASGRLSCDGRIDSTSVLSVDLKGPWGEERWNASDGPVEEFERIAPYAAAMERTLDGAHLSPRYRGVPWSDEAEREEGESMPGMREFRCPVGVTFNFSATP